MADQKKVRFDDKELPRNPGRSGGGRPRSPFPRPNTDEWATKTILSIDGGGIRGCGSLLTLQGFIEGYRSLVILRALMEDIGKVEQAYDSKATSSLCSSALGLLDDEMSVAETVDGMPLFRAWPCHYFDYIAGVGTGGIVAVMLGRCRMSVGDAIAEYREICTDITVITGQQLSYGNSLSSAKDPASKCVKAHIKKLVPAWPSPNEDNRFLQSDPERCHTIVCGCGSRLETLRSDDTISNPPLSIKHVLSQCFLAAEPSSRESYCAAKHYYANPSRTVFKEVSRTLKKKRDSAVLFDNDDDAFRSSEGDSACGDEEGIVIDLLSIGAAIDSTFATPHTKKPVDDSIATLLHSRMARQIQTVHKDLEAQTLRFDAGRCVLRHYNRLEDALPLSAAAADDDSSSSSSLQDTNIGAKDRKPKDNNTSALEGALDRIEQTTALFFSSDGDKAAKLRYWATCLVRKRRRRARTEGWERWVRGAGGGGDW